MSNRIYHRRRNPDWLLKLARFVWMAINTIKQCWRCALAIFKKAAKFIRDYRYFRARGFTVKAARFIARNTLSR